jgi:hypothetical protein
LCSSSVIKHLNEFYQEDLGTALAYYYFSFTDSEKENHFTGDGMLCSIIKQLCCQRPDTPEPLKALGAFMDKGHRPDSETLERALDAAVRRFSAVYLIVDALDECPEDDYKRGHLMDSLSRIC